MFSGIVQTTTPILDLQRLDQSMRFWIELNNNPSDPFELGESIAINGVCLTVDVIESSKERSRLRFFLSPETLEKTSFKTIQNQSLVNVERSLAFGSKNSGHFVQGHVDAIGRVISIDRRNAQDESFDVRIELPTEMFRYCISKGSICLNGVSLTINRLLDPSSIEVHIIPHTWQNTAFQQTEVLDQLNVEIDVLAKYIERLCQPHLNQK